MKLTNKQEEAYYKAVYKKMNIFITGAGGVGKSTINKKIFQDINKYNNVALTSLTGISANLIGGVTLHSYLGIRLGTETIQKIYSIISKSKKYLHRWQRLDVLMIDEISMMSLELFEKLEQLSRMIRKNNKPFGGIQLILSGDFLQLKPVKSDNFCFESKKWETCINDTIYLTEIIRQSDIHFINILNKIRIAKIDDECKTILEKRVLKYNSKKNNNIIPTLLYSTNAKVDKINNHYYSKLSGEEYTYKTTFNWKQNIYDKERYEIMCNSPYELNLKIGAQVMYLLNKDKLYNGSRGVVKSFIQGFPVVVFNNGIEKIITPETLDIEENNIKIMEYTQIPLKLCWAMSIHKSQGSTLDLVKIDFQKVFEYGQFYVALSRVRSIDGLYLKNLNWDLIKAHPKALKFYNKILNK
jgi:ATP-dependent DNA helicase PIF1